MNQIPWKIVSLYNFDHNGDFVVILDYEKYKFLKEDLEDIQLTYRTKDYENYTELDQYSSSTNPKTTYDYINPKFKEMTDDLVLYIQLLDI